MIESISPGPFHITNEGSAYLVGTIIVDQSGTNEIGCAWKESDARLFAAAPDLLECLIDLVGKIESAKWDYEITDAARAAISKALNKKGNENDHG